MATANLQIEFRLECTMLQAQLACIHGVLNAPNTRVSEIEMSALRVLNEIQEMSDAARREFGIQIERIIIGLSFRPEHAGRTHV